MCFMLAVLLEMVWAAGGCWADTNAETASRARARCLGMRLF